ncbi:MAG: hypothetical protein Q7R79_02220 [bacterium]|nr:hypothetical protein [bacterium]
METDEERARRQEREAAANERSAQAERISAVRATTDQQLTAETSVRGTIAAVKLVTSHLPREAHYAFSMLITELQSSPVYPSTIFLREYGGMLQEKADTIPEVQALLVVLSERYGVDFSTES